MKLTIAICTFNRSALLKINLESLSGILSKSDSVDLVIIDNNSTDDTVEVSKQFVDKFSNIRYVFCKEQGLSYARNCAIKEAQSSDWLAFLDDDAYVKTDWLEQGLRIISTNYYDAFGGVYYPWFRDGKKNWFLPEYESNASWIEIKDEGRLKSGFFSGGNAFYKVHCLNKVGGFPLNLGMCGDKMSYGEETRTQRAMAIQGAKLGFSHKLVIYHYTPLSKQSLRWRWKRSYIDGVLFWDIFQKERSKDLLFFYVKKGIKHSYSSGLKALKKCRDKNGLIRFFYELNSWMRVLGLLRGYFKPPY